MSVDDTPDPPSEGSDDPSAEPDEEGVDPEEVAAPPAPRRPVLRRGLAAAIGAALLLGALDVAWVLVAMAEVSVGSRAVFALYSVALLVLAGAVAGLVQVGVALGAERLAGALPPGARGACRVAGYMLLPAAALVGLVLSLTLDRWQRLGGAERGTLVFWLLAVPGLLVFVTDRALRWPRWIRSHSQARLLAVATMVSLSIVTLVAYWLDRAYLVRLYEAVHWALALAAFLAAELVVLCGAELWALWRLPRLAPRARRWRGLRQLALLGLALISAMLLPVTSETYYLVLEKTTFEAKAVRLGRLLLDFDRDGSASFLGGGDCNDLDPEISPRALDLPENAIDEDCSGTDLTLEELGPVEAPERMIRLPLTSRPNLVLVTIDALRADHVGSYGYPRNTTPSIDRVAEEAVSFDRAYAPSNNTASSFPSLLTGRYPSSSPWSFDPAEQVAKGWPFLRDADNQTLPEYLAAAGYATIAIARGDSIFGLGLRQGFDQVIPNPPSLIEAVRTGLQPFGGSEPFFLWLHYDYPHAPYEPNRLVDFGPSDLDRYDGEILRADAEIGLALHWLEQSELYDKTCIVITADHGEEFGEHGGRFHASSMYDEQVRVPLIVRVPGLAARRVSRPVSLVDVVPTVLRFAGVGARPQLDGVDLLQSYPKQFSTAYSEHYDGTIRKRAIVVGHHKLIDNVTRYTLELYDLANDPFELNNLASVKRPVVDQMLRRLSAIAQRRTLLLLATARRGDRAAVVQLASSLAYIADQRLLDYAATVVGDSGAADAIHPLERVVRDRSLRLPARNAAATALRRMGGEQVEKLLAELLADGLVDDDGRARGAARQPRRGKVSASPRLAQSAAAARSGHGAPGAELQVDVGTAGGRRHLVDGFSTDSREGGRTAAWSIGRQSRIVGSFTPRGDSYVLVVLGRAAPYLSTEALTVSVMVNGVGVGQLVIGKRWGKAMLEIDGEQLSSGDNEITLTYPETTVPAEADPQSSDRRELAVLFDRITLAPK